MENESSTKKIAFSVVGVIVIGAALFALWYRSQANQKGADPVAQQVEVQTPGAQAIEAPKDDPYGKLSIPPAQ